VSGETEQEPSGWTVDQWIYHTSVIEKWRDKVALEVDRRYSEVNIEREKALKIKEEADKVALALAREIQTYKDEKANELRSQIESERGTYITQTELKPISEYVAQQTGRQNSGTDYRNVLLAVAALAIAILTYFASK